MVSDWLMIGQVYLRDVQVVEKQGSRDMELPTAGNQTLGTNEFATSQPQKTTIEHRDV